MAMASLIFQRANFCLQISRTSKTFTVSFTTAFPRKHKPTPTISNPLRSTRSELPRTRPSRYESTRTAFTSTKVHREQEASVSAPSRPRQAYTSNSASVNASASQNDSITEPEMQDLTSGLSDKPIVLDEGARQVDWARSFHGLSAEAFSKEASDVLMQPIPPEDIEVKSDGIIYLPEIKYRRILNKAFGPGGWGLAPRGETIVTAKSVTREYALLALGRLVSVARGEQDYFSPEGIPTAVEGCKSNALMRCCKDLGVASELWDPRYIRKFMAANAREVFVEHQMSKKRKKIYIRKDDEVKYPFKETKFGM